jgi:hypothetical protein
VQIFQSKTTLIWGELDLPLLGMTSDWFGQALEPPLGFSIATDASKLWFLAARQASAINHPSAMPGVFMEGLWEHDVIELFLADPDSGAYLEFNLASNGAWWAAKFIAPRTRALTQPNFSSAISSHAQEISDDEWCAAICIPLAFLEKEISFSGKTTANATAILNSPQQTFHSIHKLPGDVPDFHQPTEFVPFSPCLDVGYDLAKDNEPLS